MTNLTLTDAKVIVHHIEQLGKINQEIIRLRSNNIAYATIANDISISPDIYIGMLFHQYNEHIDYLTAFNINPILD